MANEVAPRFRKDGRGGGDERAEDGDYSHAPRYSRRL
jgi:hypothetical protein